MTVARQLGAARRSRAGRARWAAVAAVGVLVLGAGACSLFTDFGPDGYLEDTPERCSDELDNDGDLAVDCQDDGCAAMAFCQEASDNACSDGLDNDADGLPDCLDPGCCTYAECHKLPVVLCQEASPVACGDGLDNDYDGLTDCADFDCQRSVTSCCTVVEPVIAETFDFGAADCKPDPCESASAPCCSSATMCNPMSPKDWVAWGRPRPRLSKGKLVANQPCTPCAASGLVSTAAVSLESGLYFEADVETSDASKGLMAVGLVTGEVIPRADTPCSSVLSEFPLLLGVVARGTRVEAVINGQVVASRAGVADSPQRVAVSVAKDSTVYFYRNGEVFYHSTLKVGQPGPGAAPLRTRLLIQGWSGGASVDNLLLARRTGCRNATNWVSGPNGPGAVYSPTREAKDFDSGRISNPSVLFDGDKWLMYYDGAGSTTATTSGIGLATSDDAQQWSRSGSKALTIQGETSASLSAPSVVRVPPRYLMAYRRVGAGSKMPEIAIAESVDGMVWSTTGHFMTVGAKGRWDATDVGAPAVATADGKVFLWYVGRGAAADGAGPSLGLAVLDGDGRLVKHGDKPVLTPQTNQKDDLGIFDPSVVVERKTALVEQGKVLTGLAQYRFHLWYVGRTWTSRAQINYAVSDDGKRWVRYPANPVIPSGKTGLFGNRSMFSPSVVERWGSLMMWYGGSEPDGLPSIGFAVNAP